MEAVYDGHDVFHVARTGYGIDTTHGLQAGSRTNSLQSQQARLLLGQAVGAHKRSLDE